MSITMLNMIVFANLLIMRDVRGSTCGVDESTIKNFRGDFRSADVQEFPWLGVLYYPNPGGTPARTDVVLVTVQIVLGSAVEFSKIPKKHFRTLSRVILGRNCSDPGIPVREYIYHPEFRRSTKNTLALVQLDLDHVKRKLMPICSPPNYITDPTFYAMRMYSDDKCFNTVNIYKMDYVSLEDCHTFYNQPGLDFGKNNTWPRYPACGKGMFGGDCMWFGGTALAIRQNGRWRLMGIGLHGPGCQAPSKFLDYLKYEHWVKDVVISPGRTTLTRLGTDHLILRRSLSHVQRFGECDDEETIYEIFSDNTTVDADYDRKGITKYNLTLVETVAYSCIVLRARHHDEMTKPKIRLHRWCAAGSKFCYDHHHTEIRFSVMIYFTGPVTYKVTAYGTHTESMNPVEAMKYVNKFARHPRLPKYLDMERYAREDRSIVSWMPQNTFAPVKKFYVRRYEVYEYCMNNVTWWWDKRFCAQYEFTVEPWRWFEVKESDSKYSYYPLNYRHFVWRYLSQRKKLQFPMDDYTVIIDPEEQDENNKYLETKYRYEVVGGYKKSIWIQGYLETFVFEIYGKPLYDPYNYDYDIYGLGRGPTKGNRILMRQGRRAGHD